MKILFNGWFSGFIEKTNPGIHVTFFLELFEKVYGVPCEIGTLEYSDVLCEFDMLLNTNSLVNSKQWKHTFLYSGESWLKCKKNNYTCVLWGERNHKNVINVPLYIPYIYTNNFKGLLENTETITKVPRNDVCVVISNPNGHERNKFLLKLEKYFDVKYLGRYKNNVGKVLDYPYNTHEYRNVVGKYKFAINMENSRTDTYITEKIVNGILSGCVPIYWGSEYIYDYINKERFFNIQNVDSCEQIINDMKNLSDRGWLNMVNSNPFPNGTMERTIDDIAEDILWLLSNSNWNSLSKICCVTNPKFEPERCKMLDDMFRSQNIDKRFVKYISPTYKHTISDILYNQHISKQLVLTMRKNIMKKSELSLFLNYKATLKFIAKNFKDGMFLILESDALIGKDIQNFHSFLKSVNDKKWDLIHIGMFDNRIWETPNFKNNIGYSDRIFHSDILTEDITTPCDDFRLSRKFFTRCTDSFIWNYTGIIKFLNWMENIEPNFGVPFDYYMCNFFEKNIDFKHYWSNDEFFKQGSNIGLIKSSIQ